MSDILFEVPYNFDKELIKIYYMYKEQEHVQYSSIYLPAFWEDDNSVIRTPSQGRKFKNMTRDEYVEHIKYIQTYFPDKIMILLQQPNYVLTEDTLKFYLDLGINKFCVNGLEKAKLIKSLKSDAYVACSITAKLTPEDIITNIDTYRKYYDNIILFWYPFNRNLNILKKLPRNMKYTLLANSCCSMKCDGARHWYRSQVGEMQDVCPLRQPDYNMDTDFALIDPRHLDFFAPYIYSFKLQDRGDTTARLMSVLGAYIWSDKCYVDRENEIKRYELDNYELKL